MAKTAMICPFSTKACAECPIYRGRHYLICYNENYRGHMKGVRNEKKEVSDCKPVGSNIDISYDILKFRPGHVYDPFLYDQKDYEKGG